MNNETIILIFWILTTHWIADFIAQPREVAEQKGNSFSSLTIHTMFYSVLFLLSMGVYAGAVLHMKADPVVGLAVLFGLITFIFHTITDYYTSKLSTYLWEAGQKQDFFVLLGLDQLLHFVQLFLTYQLLY